MSGPSRRPPASTSSCPSTTRGENVGRALEEIDRNVPLAKRVLVVYDFDEDDTVPAVRGCSRGIRGSSW